MTPDVQRGRSTTLLPFGRSIDPYDIGLPLKPRPRRNLAGLARTHAAHAGLPLGLSYGSGDTGKQHGPDRTQRQDSTWWAWPRGAHSAKPEAFLDMVEQALPGPYMEMFARRARFGWDYFGDQSLGTATMEAA